MKLLAATARLLFVMIIISIQLQYE